MKQYYIQYGVGTAKYLVSFHDGEKKHKDGSRFFDAKTFTNKRKLLAFVDELERDGYTSTGGLKP